MSAYVVCVRDVAGGEDQYGGPFYSASAAEAMERKIVRFLTREGIYGSTHVDTAIEEITPARQWRTATWA